MNQQKKNRFSFIPFKSNNASNNSKQSTVSFSNTELINQSDSSQAMAQPPTTNQSDTIENILKKYKTSSSTTNAQTGDRESQIIGWKKTIILYNEYYLT